jgi:chromosome segregation ATPase
MHPPRLRPVLALLTLLAFSGCTYVHFGRQAGDAAALAAQNATLQAQNTNLEAQNGQLQQELAVAQKQGTTLKAMLENSPEASAASRQLVADLNETTRQLAGLRADYARLQAERDRLASPAAAKAAAPADNAEQITDLQTQLGDTENKLAVALRTYTQLERENSELHTEIDKVHDENSSLAARVKDLTAQNQSAQAALAQLNTELLAQKEARARTEQDAENLRTQLSAAREEVATLSAARAASAGNAQTISPGVTINADATAREPDARFESSAARARAAKNGEVDTADLVNQLSELRARVGTLEAERDGLKQQLAAASGAAPPADASSAADTEAKLASALRSYTVVQNENDQLRAEGEKIAAEKAAIEAQLAATKGALPIAAQANALREQLRQTQAQAAALAAENSHLRTQLALNGPVAVPSVAPTRPAAVAAAANGPPSSDQAGPASSGAPVPRTHTIVAGDTLAKISRQYYGTPDRWPEILAANRDILHDEKSLVIGRVIRIP